ncbi:L-seryl-tRNA(Sec) selenium transferase [Corynebacterium guangdongense]|uniref:L-seryl-tRNA(Sec) selenium transferase n=1 Tax=Corynebacterium guangdongense TaxID=1783348 RepID=A0ABU1ZVN8_9CORY|nr:L-seryl-tRNA(Sec) selenium transferase [Corynebacterium guangdongense]MDR7328991.1 L-seryl-tRNA(Ser) seleniumtransferase [Corynebacterium guangdongense]WJZ17562.1 L-seryl-tRNA(Sec) selenium transferase [Corynebacterium guangdongense]
MSADPRRRIPRTDDLLALEEVQASPLADAAVRAAIDEAQSAARRLEIAPEEVAPRVIAAVSSARPSSLTPVLNATGVIVHTNIGRAPLSPAATQALVDAAGYADVEMDLDSGQRSPHRGLGAKKALLAACPGAEDALVVNNGAAALLLATTALAEGGEVVISRGELIEIGAGFRLPELIESARVDLHEIGATNRTHPADYERALARPNAKAVLKVHPSNFRVEGFTASVSTEQLRPLADETGAALIVDLGSGLLHHDPVLPDEPDIAAEIAAGADVVIASGDKLLGGPQAGILLGRAETIRKLKKHPLARAVRVDKLRLAALEATLTSADVPVREYLHADPDELKARATALASAVGGEVVAHDGRVGGGGAPGFELPGWAVRLPSTLARPLRTGTPSVLGRVHDGACLIDLRCVPPAEDATLIAAVRRAQEP